MSMRSRCRLPMLLVSVGLTGCLNADGPARLAEVRDSAGVRIVDNHGGAWPEDAVWEVGTALLDVGGHDVAPEYQLYEVRGGTRLPDGSVVIADNGSHQLRFYDSSGTYLKSAGREGQGPGEFGGIWRMELYRRDSLLVWDNRNMRLSVHDRDGRFVRTFMLDPSAEGVARFPGRELIHFRDGSLLGLEWLGQQLAEAGHGVVRTEATLLRFDAEGHELESIGTFPWMEYYVSDEQVVMPNGMAMNSRAPLMFGLTLQLAAADSSFWVGAGDPELSQYDMQGQLLQRVRRLDLERRPATPALVAQFIEVRLAALEQMNNGEDFRARQRRLMEDMPTADFLPAYGWMLVDREGNLWVRHDPGVEDPEDPRPSLWDVFGPSGSFLGTVELPQRFVPLEIGADYVLGVQKDELDLEYVLLLPLLKDREV